ncbi:MAG: serine hydrolase [Acidobacteria bacterium]|nr:serine hydrolase [Acidobacteriota bacterium]
MKNLIVTGFLLLLACSFALGQDKVEVLDKYIESSRKAWNVPGMAVTVVQDGKVIFAKGYGVRELGKDPKVDTETLFGCMSTTKAMTAVALATLVDEGKLSWDDKVIKYLPAFRIADPYVTNELRIRDLLTHNTGVGNADFLWAWTPEIGSDEIVRRMQYAPQEYTLRGGFIYQNIMYLVAGQVIEKVSGISWDRFMKERIFDPLGMKNTFPSYEYHRRYNNRSSAHFEVKGKIRPIPEDSADPVAPAGAVWSTADDIGKWVNFMLGNTTVNGKQLLKPETYAELLRPQVVIPPAGGFYPTAALTKPHWTTYGLGWFQHDYRGEMVNFHTGSLDGRTAIIGLIADKKLGVYVFGNLDHAEVRHALMYKVFDLFGFADNSRDWSTDFKALYAGLKTEAEKATEGAKAKRKTDTKPSLPLEAYAGKYADPFFGEMTVELVGGKLRLIVAKELSAELGHWQFDTFSAAWNKEWWGESLISFRLGAVSGEVEAIDLDGAVLRRVPKSE